MNENFTVYRDGEVDTRFARKKRFQATTKAFMAGTRSALAPLNVGIKRALDEWELYEYDQRHHTHLLRDYREKIERAKLDNMRRQYGLV